MFHARSFDRPALLARSAYGAAIAPRWWTSFAMSIAALLFPAWAIVAAWVMASDLFALTTGYVAVLVPRVRFLICNYDEQLTIERGIGLLLLAGATTHTGRLLRHAGKRSNGR